jgi:hypothetical protein
MTTRKILQTGCFSLEDCSKPPFQIIMKTSHESKSSSHRAEAQKMTLDNSESHRPHQPVNPTVVSDDQLGPDETLDEANAHVSEAPGTAAGEVEALTSDHRILKMEPNDEHNGEDLIEEGLQGYMHGSLTKPRKTI